MRRELYFKSSFSELQSNRKVSLRRVKLTSNVLFLRTECKIVTNQRGPDSHVSICRNSGMVYLSLTIYFVEALHLWFVVKIFPDEATPDKYAEQSEKNNKKFIIFKQTSGLFLMYYDGNGT